MGTCRSMEGGKIMDNKTLLQKLIEIAKLSGREKLPPAKASEFERLAYEVLNRMDYQVDPYEIKVRVSKIKHFSHRMGEIYLSIRQNQEYDDLARETKQLEAEIDQLLKGGIE